MPQLPPADPNTAQLEQADQTKPLVLTAGKVTPQILHEWEEACDGYFYHKKVKAEDQVHTVVLGLKDYCVADWYRASQVEVIALTFDEFKTALHKKLLKKDWEHIIKQEVLSSKQGNMPFDDWRNGLGAKNSLIMGTPYHVDKNQFCSHLSSNLHLELSTDCNDTNLHLVEDFQEWVESVSVLDGRRH